MFDIVLAERCVVGANGEKRRERVDGTVGNSKTISPTFYSSKACTRPHIKWSSETRLINNEHRLPTRAAYNLSLPCGWTRTPSANDPNEAVNGSQEAVLCFDGLIQDADHPPSSLGTLTGCARINSAHSVSYSELSAFQATVRHIIRLDGRGTIVDDDEASILPLINPLSGKFTHGVTAFAEEPNIVAEDGKEEFQGKEGVVQVMGRMNLAGFPSSLIFEAIFDITIF
ncbi:hypothetical protein QOT17_003657 [Balamuthia mandrillaris]